MYNNSEQIINFIKQIYTYYFPYFNEINLIFTFLRLKQFIHLYLHSRNSDCYMGKYIQRDDFASLTDYKRIKVRKCMPLV